MKKLLFMIAAVVMLFTACDKDCDHDFIEVDHSKDIVGTWTCLETDYASALVFTADGSAISMGVGGNEYWENVDGNYSIENNNLLISFESGYNVDVRIDLIPNEYLSIVDKDGNRHTYHYCTNDLSDEILGMWMSMGEEAGPDEESIAINTFDKNGKSYLTAFMDGVDEYVVNMEGDYKVVGDLLIKFVKGDSDTPTSYIVMGLDYMPNGTAFGDIMTMHMPAYGAKPTFLRIKQHLDLAGNKYDYIKTFVTNVKGEDKDIEFMGYTFNFAKMDGVVLDKMLKTVLFAVQFPDANTIRYTCQYNDFNMVMDAPIDVDGNKMTIKMSQRDAAYKDVDLYTFQDQDNTQMHMYMPTYAFINFFANMQIAFMSELGEIDKTDAAAVKAVFDSIDNAVETINVSFVMTKAQK
jgi:hypothetical protein